MKIVQPFTLGLVIPTLTLLAACSGTRAPENTQSAQLDPISGELAGDSRQLVSRQLVDLTVPETTALQVQDPQGNQDKVRQDRNKGLLASAMKNARRALELKLWKDAVNETAFVLELQPQNEEARRILLTAREALGDTDAAGQRVFDDNLTVRVVAEQRARFKTSRLLQEGEVLEQENRFGDAIERYEQAILFLEYSPLVTPGDALLKRAKALRDAAQQAQANAMANEQSRRTAQSQQDLADAERINKIQRDAKVTRLVSQANRDFQGGQFKHAVDILDQALFLDPNNEHAIALRDLADRARHENNSELYRSRWKSEWAATFDDLNTANVPQTEIFKFDMARWAEVSTRKPKIFTPPEDLDSPEERAITKKLSDTVLDHKFASATVDDWSKYYASVTGVNFIVHSSVREMDEEQTTLTELSMPAKSVTKALDVITALTQVKWRVSNGVVELIASEAAVGKTYLIPYGVQDLVLGVANKAGPELKLRVPGEEDEAVEEDEPAPTVVDDGKLQDLIRNNIQPETWDEVGTISYQNGVLLVRHTKDVHEKVQKMLGDLRQAVGIQVDVEARFLKVQDSFLEDIGVDWRGLGNQASEGLPGRGLEQNNRGNLRFDDFGRPELINSASSGQIGTGTEPGMFFDDGGDGDYLARTENLYDQTLGNGQDGLTNSGGLAAQFAFLDDTELEIVLRAVSKQERSEEIVAPRLLVYNNTRASMQALRHTSYIKDFDVEIAQASAVANPVVDVVRDGVVLDVRPVVSADRRFITMELRPTVMQLELPIPTFTTTLGAGQPVSIQLPNVTLQRVRTTITMPDGATVMLGGMKTAERQKQESGIPILKDLPLLGFFFSRKGTFIENRKVIILIKATIIMSEEHEPEVHPSEFETMLQSR